MIIQDEQHDIETPTGPMRTYLYRPVISGVYPGVIYFSEIFQQTGPIRRQASMIAGHGYVVVVPEIFHELETPGAVLAYDKAGTERGNHDKITKTIKSYDDDARALIKFLQSYSHCSGELGALGVCIGGHLSFRAAMNPEILCAGCFYATDIHKRSLGAGLNDNSIDRIPEIRGELMMVWGRQDPHIPVEGRKLIYDRLTEAQVNYTWHEFNAAHAFMRDEGPRYDSELAILSTQLVLSLLHRNL